MCTVLLPPGDNPIAVNKYITSTHIISYKLIPHISHTVVANLIWCNVRLAANGATRTKILNGIPMPLSAQNCVTCTLGHRVVIFASTAMIQRRGPQERRVQTVQMPHSESWIHVRAVSALTRHLWRGKRKFKCSEGFYGIPAQTSDKREAER